MNKEEAEAAIRQAAQAVIAQKQRQPFQVEVRQELTAGPLPPPEVLLHYNQTVPNGADRIVQMAEREQKHVHTLQNWSVALTLLGEIFAWSIVVIAMLGAFYLVLKDKRLEGAASFLIALAMLATGYYSRWKSKPGEKAQSKPTQRPRP